MWSHSQAHRRVRDIAGAGGRWIHGEGGVLQSVSSERKVCEPGAPRLTDSEYRFSSWKSLDRELHSGEVPNTALAAPHTSVCTSRVHPAR